MGTAAAPSAAALAAVLLLSPRRSLAEPPAAAIAPGERFAWNEPLTYVVFGATGDLAKKKLYPAFSELLRHGWIPPTVNIIGYGRSEYTMEKLWAKQAVNVKGPEQHRERVFARCEYFRGGYDNEADHKRLDARIRELAGGRVDNRILFLAVPPSSFGPICASATRNLRSQTGFTRIIIEKPFGRDAETFAELNAITAGTFHESEIYRLDHYLGKEVIMNFVTQRFANAVLEPSWSNKHIAAVEINWQEDIGTGGRGGYFDDIGIIRDVMQNHLLQVLVFVAMERPSSLRAGDVIAAKTELLRHVRTLGVGDAVLGQFGPGASSKGKEPGYLDDPTVPAGSNASTYAMLHLQVDSDRWHGVPFLMTAGKGLNERLCEVRVTFKRPPGGLFPEAAPNEFVMRVQPGEALYIKQQTKVPGLEAGAARTTTMDFAYTDAFGSTRIADAYERVLLNTARGDQTLFIGTDELTEAWRIFSPLLHEIEDTKLAPHHYAFGTQGPAAASALRERLGVPLRPSYETHLCEAAQSPPKLRAAFRAVALQGAPKATEQHFREYLRGYYDGRAAPAGRAAAALRVHDPDGDGAATFEEFAEGAVALCRQLGHLGDATCAAGGGGCDAAPAAAAGGGVVRLGSEGAVAAALRAAILAAQGAALRRGGRFSLAVSGGSAARVLGAALSGAEAAWDKWEVFFADERMAPLDSADSNFNACREALARVPQGQVHAVDTTKAAAIAAEDYHSTIRQVLGEGAHFDLLVLGVGPDGHTMSLFPEHEVLDVRLRLAAAVLDSPKPPAQRVTLTLSAASAARGAVFVAMGADKAEAVRRGAAPAPGDNPRACPAGMVARAAEAATWLVDDAAAALLP